jgi:divalent metal cation (Fe/Co/Zn/Cd) transporter
MYIGSTLPKCVTNTPADSKKCLSRTSLMAKITLLSNIILTIAKLVASYLSGSLSIISSLVDSIVEITSGIVIWVTSHAINKSDPYIYPVGRSRLEPIALVIVRLDLFLNAFNSFFSILV